MYLVRKIRLFSLVVIVLIGMIIFGLGNWIDISRALKSGGISFSTIKPMSISININNSSSSSSSIGSSSMSSTSSSTSGNDKSITNIYTEESTIRRALHSIFKDAKSANWSAVFENQLRRQHQLAQACRKLGLGRETPNFRTSDMYVNDTLRYIYCVVNKVANTSWKRVLLLASGEIKDKRPEQLSMTFVHNWRMTDRYMPRIRNYNLEEVEQRLKTHFKFLFVRHPLERLVSTYRDKFTKPAYYYKRRFGTKIIRAIRGASASEESLRKGHDVKFREMVLYLLNPGPTKRRDDTLLSDNHWRLQNELCHPCYVKYDFIGHYETLYDDAQFVLDKLGVLNRVQFPNVDPDNRWKQKTGEVAAKILSELSDAELDQVRQLYRTDFELFGYNDHTPVGNYNKTS